ncbi:MAG: hypothetical protein AAF591_23255 [Verrucomicrobiota bacterium]
MGLDLVMGLGVLALAAVLLLPVWQRWVLREKAEVLREDLVAIERAVAEAALRGEVEGGVALSFEEYRKYLGDEDRVKGVGRDPFGESYGEQYVDEVPVVPMGAYERLRVVVPDLFWAPYGVPKGGKKGTE